jgi:hypothetical protein
MLNLHVRWSTERIHLDAGIFCLSAIPIQPHHTIGTRGIGTRYSMVLCRIVYYVNSNPTEPGSLHANFKSVNRRKIGKPENSFWSPA